ncbi:unnamed protein product, partial [Ascophyllum nodosum]
ASNPEVDGAFCGRPWHPLLTQAICGGGDRSRLLKLGLLSVVATTAAIIQGSAPKTRQRIHEPRRLEWEEHRVDLARRGMFRRMYRMEEQTFNKLAELLRPILSHNDYYASDGIRMVCWRHPALYRRGTSTPQAVEAFAFGKRPHEGDH